MRGAPIPDAVIFDLKYRTANDEQVRASLRSLLSSSISVVQVYTNDPLDVAKDELRILLSEFPSRLVDPKSKADTSIQALSEAIKEQVDKSLSAKLAKELRKLSLKAVEDVLVKIDDLPDSTLLGLLGGKEEAAEEADLLELLSVKVGEALAAAPDLSEALQQYMASKGIPEDRRAQMVRAIADLVVGNAQESIRNSGGLLALAQNWEHAQLQRAANAAAEDLRSKKVIRDFFQFRVYTSPPETDRNLLTGDIVMVIGKENVQDNGVSLPDLYLVVTPLCDLAHFWHKTRGALTLVRMSPIDERGSQEIRSGSNQTFKISGSITASNPLMLPSVRLLTGQSADYAIFPHEVLFERVLLAAGLSAKKPLTYDSVEGLLTRQCRISEPFLTGILDKIRGVLFRSGIPDFPDQERERITKLFADLKPKI